MLQRTSLLGTVVVMAMTPTHTQQQLDRESSTYILSSGPVDSSSSRLPRLEMSIISSVLFSAVFVILDPTRVCLSDVAAAAASVQLKGLARAVLLYSLPLTTRDIWWQK